MKFSPHPRLLSFIVEDGTSPVATVLWCGYASALRFFLLASTSIEEDLHTLPSIIFSYLLYWHIYLTGSMKSSSGLVGRLRMGMYRQRAFQVLNVSLICTYLEHGGEGGKSTRVYKNEKERICLFVDKMYFSSKRWVSLWSQKGLSAGCEEMLVELRASEDVSSAD